MLDLGIDQDDEGFCTVCKLWLHWRPEHALEGYDRLVFQRRHCVGGFVVRVNFTNSDPTDSQQQGVSSSRERAVKAL
jgi:hypothetical protein